MEIDKIFPPIPIYNLYLYPVIPNILIKKFMELLPNSLNKWLIDKKDSEFYKLLGTFIEAFKIQDICDFIDKPNKQQFTKLLETNPLYAPSNGGMEFFEFTPISMFCRWLLSNQYEGPPINLRHDYKKDVFDENVKIICGDKFNYFKNLYSRLEEFVDNFENQTLENFTYLTRQLFCFPLEDIF